ncbi:cGMP-dependent protein kinase interacting domain-containing protein [Ditylenchus destructor]|nr:cGMP-dependent protein kinase interacting domain-containing protein [Ditylenchus destructor]
MDTWIPLITRKRSSASPSREKIQEEEAAVRKPTPPCPTPGLHYPSYLTLDSAAIQPAQNSPLKVFGTRSRKSQAMKIRATPDIEDVTESDESSRHNSFSNGRRYSDDGSRVRFKLAVKDSAEPKRESSNLIAQRQHSRSVQEDIHVIHCGSVPKSVLNEVESSSNWRRIKLEKLRGLKNPSLDSIDKADTDAFRARGDLSKTSSKGSMDRKESAESNELQRIRLLYERQKEENQQLRQQIDQLNQKLVKKESIANGNVATGVGRRQGGYASAMDDQERRQYERRISALEYELEVARQLEAENNRLKAENEALIRVLSKISRQDPVPTRRPNNFNPITKS